jgi:hypothetical protein
MRAARRPPRLALLVPCLAALALGGCASMGPPTIARDRFDYVSAVSESWKQQMLLNLLKVRYFDAPVFMDVASVINSYSLEGEVTFADQAAPVGREGDTFRAFGATGRYADRPTISYNPLTGDKFARNLMTPLPISGVLMLIQGGYAADVVMRICVNTINGLENAYGGAGNARPGDPQFREFLAALRESQATGGMGMRVKSLKDAQTVIMFVQPGPQEALNAPIGRIRELLHLDPAINEYEVVFGSQAENQRQIAMLTRSVMQVMMDFASYIDIPEADLAEGRAYRPQRSPGVEKLFPPTLRVHHGDKAPTDAYVAVRYRGRWFWVDDRDHQSKAMFTSVLFLFSLTETGAAQAAPVVTIPAR